MGSWKANGEELVRNGDGTYSVTCEPKGQTLEYKINRGSWETVEKGAAGEEIANRTVDLDGDKMRTLRLSNGRIRGTQNRRSRRNRPRRATSIITRIFTPRCFATIAG